MRERLGVLGQLAGFLWTQRLWWLLPIVIGLAVIGALTIVGASTPLGPLLYPLF